MLKLPEGKLCQSGSLGRKKIDFLGEIVILGITAAIRFLFFFIK